MFAKLNECFGLDSFQRKNVQDTLDELEKEGLEYEITEKQLKKEYVNNVVEYLESIYSEDFMYNNKSFLKYAVSTAKLIHNPNHDIANSLSNILRYIAMKKQYLILGERPDLSIFNEQFYDQHLKLSFKYTLMLMKANIVSYSIECDKFERPDLSDINLSGIQSFPHEENTLRVIEDFQENGDFSSAQNFVVINGIRNAIAHGKNRLTITTGKNKEIILSDLFDQNHELHITGGVEDFDKIFSHPCFKPDNIKVKNVDKAKIKTYEDNKKSS